MILNKKSKRAKRKSRTHPQEQEVTTRKSHLCDYCGVTIPAGSKATLVYSRQPDYDKDDKQTGVYYGRWYFCVDKDKCQNNRENL